MYTISKFGDAASIEKTVTRPGYNFASVSIEVSAYKGEVEHVFVSAYSSPFGEKSRYCSQFFRGASALREAWKLFKGFQTILGGEFCDD